MNRVRRILCVLLAVAILWLPNAVLSSEEDEPGTEMTYGDYRYMRLPSGISITKYHGDDSEVTIPELIAGVRVRNIAAEAFAWNPRIEKVMLPNTVQFIGLNAFIECINLERVIWPESLRGIGVEAFRGCTSLREVKLPSGLSYVGEAAFEGCTALETLTLPKSLYDIGPRAFSGCESLRTAAIHGSATTGTFLPEEAPFAGCVNLEQFFYGGTVEALVELLPNDLAASIDVYLIDVNELAEAAEIRKCLVPPGELVLPVMIGSFQLKAIQAEAFTPEAQVGRVFYLGTQSQWDQMEIGEGNAPLEADNVTCLARNLDYTPLQPYWDEEMGLIIGLSIADLSDMPLRGIDFIHAEWDLEGPEASSSPAPSSAMSPVPELSPGPSLSPDHAPAETLPETAGSVWSDNLGAGVNTSSLKLNFRSGMSDASGTASAIAEPDDNADPGSSPASDRPSAMPSTSPHPDVSPAAVPSPRPSLEPEIDWTGYAFFNQDLTQISRYEILGTGCTVVRRSETGKMEEAQIVLTGDVTGSGVMNITQLVRLARALSGSDPLDDPYEIAGDLDRSGRIDIADLSREASWLLTYGL